MKNILLTSTALVAFAGAAFAESHASDDGVSFTGTAYLGFNDDDVWGEDGFYWAANLAVTMSKALDNGVTAAATFNIEVDDESGEGDSFEGDASNDYSLASSSYVLSLTSETASLFFGDTKFAAETHWKSAGDMHGDAFSESDGEVVLRGDIEMAGVSASVSMLVADEAGNYTSDAGENYDQLSFGLSGDIGMFNYSVAYQDEAVLGNTGGNGDFESAEAFGISGGASFAGADVTVAYAQQSAYIGDDELQSFGVKVAYPFGPVTATVYYVAEDTKNSGDADDNYGLQLDYAAGAFTGLLKVRSEGEINTAATETEWNIEGAYDLGNGLVVLAGALNENEGDDADFYVGGTYDLGGGASILAMYAEDKDGDQEDEIGSAEYLPGTTVKVAFTF
ncbi:porin [Yoonia sp. MH D7]